MFRNILSNAFKFTPVGGVVEVRILVEETRLLIEVQDSGVGISAENQKRLFNEVVQFHAKAHQGGGGSGLGLWISKKIVDMHGGSIGVRSEGEGRGSTFFFSLPMQLAQMKPSPSSVHRIPLVDMTLGSRSCDADIDPPQFEARPYHPPPAARSIHEAILAPGPAPQTEYGKDMGPDFRKTLKVLVVDDSALNRKMMVNRLERIGCVTFVADDGDTAVAMVQQTLGTSEEYDVITMDNVYVFVLLSSELTCCR